MYNDNVNKQDHLQSPLKVAGGNKHFNNETYKYIVDMYSCTVMRSGIHNVYKQLIIAIKKKFFTTIKKVF